MHTGHQIFRLPKNPRWSIYGPISLLGALLAAQAYTNNQTPAAICIILICGCIIFLVAKNRPDRHDTLILDLDANKFQIGCERSGIFETFAVTEISNASIEMAGLRTRYAKLTIKLTDTTEKHYFFNPGQEKGLLSLHSEEIPRQLVFFIETINRTKGEINERNN